MTNGRLAELTVMVNTIEREIRARFRETVDPQESEELLVLVRQAVALRKPMERILAARACRAHVGHVSN